MRKLKDGKRVSNFNIEAEGQSVFTLGNETNIGGYGGGGYNETVDDSLFEQVDMFENKKKDNVLRMSKNFKDKDKNNLK